MKRILSARALFAHYTKVQLSAFPDSLTLVLAITMFVNGASFILLGLAGEKRPESGQ